MPITQYDLVPALYLIDYNSYYLFIYKKQNKKTNERLGKRKA